MAFSPAWLVEKWQKSLLPTMQARSRKQNRFAEENQMKVKFIIDGIVYTGSIILTLNAQEPEGSENRWRAVLEPSPCSYRGSVSGGFVGTGDTEITAIHSVFGNEKDTIGRLVEIVPDNENPGKVLAAILDEVRVMRKDVHRIMERMFKA
jgi:hypothetical protein